MFKRTTTTQLQVGESCLSFIPYHLAGSRVRSLSLYLSFFSSFPAHTLCIITMRSAPAIAAGLAALAQTASSVSVSGTAEGFAASVTGGGDATAV